MTTVQSIERAFAVLRALVPGAAGVTQIAEQIELPKSTVSRLLATLEQLGVVEQVAAGGGYRIGPGMADIAAAARSDRSILAAARPQVTELSRRTGEAAGVSGPDGAEMLYLGQVNPDRELQVRDWTGTRIPMHAVPSGQVVLAEMDDHDLETYLGAPLARFTAATLVEPARLRARLADVRRLGYAVAVDEFADGLSSVAAPVRDRAGRVVGALHVYGPTSRLVPREPPGAGHDPTGHDPAALGAAVADAASRVRVD
jgi:DNA-binding IclR family transcriptional regulator